MKICSRMLNSERGMSLVQVVIAAGIMSMLALFMMKMQENQSKTQNDIAAKAEITSFMQKLDSLLGSPGYCEKNLNGKSVSEGGDSKISLNEIVSPAGKKVFSVGEVYGDRQIILKSIEQKEFFFDDKERTRGILSFWVALEKKKRSFGAKVVKKTLDVVVSVNELGRIEGCASSTASSSVGTTGSSSIDPAAIQKVIEKARDGQEVEGLDEKKIKKIIDNNPALKQMQEAIKNMNKSNKAMEEAFKDSE